MTLSNNLVCSEIDGHFSSAFVLVNKRLVFQFISVTWVQCIVQYSLCRFMGKSLSLCRRKQPTIMQQTFTVDDFKDTTL